MSEVHRLSFGLAHTNIALHKLLTGEAPAAVSASSHAMSTGLPRSIQSCHVVNCRHSAVMALGEQESCTVEVLSCAKACITQCGNSNGAHSMQIG